MKANYFFILLALFCTVLITSCAKYEVGYEGKANLVSYAFEPSANPDLDSRVEGVFEGDYIYIRVPNSVPIRNAVASFTTNSEKAIVYVNNVVQQSGVSAIDLSDTTTYRIATPNDMGHVHVIALRNAALVRYGFYAEDNEGILFKDYMATIDGLDITVNVPTDADITQLVSRFTTSSGAVVKVNGTTQTSGQMAHDFTNPIQYDVTDAETVEPEKFVVTVGRSTTPEWVEMRSSVLLGYTSSSDAKLAINPTNNLPSITFAHAAINSDNATRKAIVLTYTGTTWEALGNPAGFSNGYADGPTIAIDDNGKYYVAFKDRDGSLTTAQQQFGSIMTYRNGEWQYLSSQRSTPQRVNNMHIVTNKNNIPIISYSGASALNGYNNRNTNSELFINNAWVVKTINPAQSSYYTRVKRGADGHVYYANLDMTGGTSIRLPMVYKLNDQTLTWEAVSTQFAAPTPTTYAESLLDFTVDKDGTIYLVYQSQPTADKKSYVMKFDGASWKQIGDFISHTAGSSGERNNIAVAIHPNGTLYFAHGDANGLKVTTFNEDTQNWNTAEQIHPAVPNKIDLQITEDGIPYLLTLIDDKPTMFKCLNTTFP